MGTQRVDWICAVVVLSKYAVVLTDCVCMCMCMYVHVCVSVFMNIFYHPFAISVLY